jgi:hypothetical protein
MKRKLFSMMGAARDGGVITRISAAWLPLICALALGLVLAGCDNGSSPDNPGGEDKTLSVSIAVPSGSTFVVVTTVTTETDLLAFADPGNVTYQWNNDDGAIPGATSRQYRPNEVGTYTVTVSAEGYQSKTSNAVTVISPLTWTAVTAANNGGFGTINGVAYGGASGQEKFVAVGESGKIATSGDGVSWTAVTAANNGGFSTINGVAYGNGTWVAVGNSGKIATSGDGASWTAVSDSTFDSSIIKGVAYNNGTWVAVGESGKIATSGDGASWTAVSDSTFGTSTIIGVVYGGAGDDAGWVAVSYGKIATSGDGASWTAVSSNLSNLNSTIYYDMAYGNGKWVAVGASGSGSGSRGIMACAYSGHVRYWTTSSSDIFSGSGAAINGVAYGNGKWVAVGASGKIAYCAD